MDDAAEETADELHWVQMLEAADDRLLLCDEQLSVGTVVTVPLFPIVETVAIVSFPCLPAVSISIVVAAAPSGESVPCAKSQISSLHGWVEQMPAP